MKPFYSSYASGVATIFSEKGWERPDQLNAFTSPPRVSGGDSHQMVTEVKFYIESNYSKKKSIFKNVNIFRPKNTFFYEKFREI